MTAENTSEVERGGSRELLSVRLVEHLPGIITLANNSKMWEGSVVYERVKTYIRARAHEHPHPPFTNIVMRSPVLDQEWGIQETRGAIIILLYGTGLDTTVAELVLKQNRTSLEPRRITAQDIDSNRSRVRGRRFQSVEEAINFLATLAQAMKRGQNGSN